MQDYNNFTTYVCNAYKGIVKPSVCKLPAANISSMRKASAVHPVFHRGEAKNLTSLGTMKIISRSRKAFQKGFFGFRGWNLILLFHITGWILLFEMINFAFPSPVVWHCWITEAEIWFHKFSVSSRKLKKNVLYYYHNPYCCFCAQLGCS